MLTNRYNFAKEYSQEKRDLESVKVWAGGHEGVEGRNTSLRGSHPIFERPKKSFLLKYPELDNCICTVFTCPVRPGRGRVDQDWHQQR